MTSRSPKISPNGAGPAFCAGFWTETMKIVLLVTWIVSGQPPSSYQVEFGSWEKCDAARDAVLRDRDQMVKSIGAMMMGPGTHYPVVSVVCVEK
jgi:hypothetical protein